MDNTRGKKSNRVSLNIAHVHMGMEPPEEGIATVFIDGQPIHAPHFIQVTAIAGEVTKVSLQFEAEVTGTIGGEDVNEMIREMRGE